MSDTDVQVDENVMRGAIGNIKVEQVKAGQERPYADHVDIYLVTFTAPVQTWRIERENPGPAFTNGTQEWSSGRVTDARPAFIELALRILNCHDTTREADHRSDTMEHAFAPYVAAEVVDDGVVRVTHTTPYVD